jgi:hypothetical protein
MSMAGSVAQAKSPVFPQALSKAEISTASGILTAQKKLGESVVAVFHSYLAWAEARLRGALATASDPAHPRLLALSIDPLQRSVTTDILFLNSRLFATGEADEPVAATATFSQGVCASVLEGVLLRRLSGARRAALINSISLTRLAEEDGTGWLAVDQNSLQQLDRLRLPPETRRNLEEILADNKIVVLPKSERFWRSRRAVWWELDGHTGMVLGMVESGIGGAEAAVGAQQDRWADFAAAYAPGLTRGWPALLAEWCRTGSRLHSGGPYNLSAEELEELRDALLMVYGIVSSAVADNPELELSPQVKNLLSPAGRGLIVIAASAFSSPI